MILDLSVGHILDLQIVVPFPQPDTHTGRHLSGYLVPSRSGFLRMGLSATPVLWPFTDTPLFGHLLFLSKGSVPFTKTAPDLSLGLLGRRTLAGRGGGLN